MVQDSVQHVENHWNRKNLKNVAEQKDREAAQNAEEQKKNLSRIQKELMTSTTKLEITHIKSRGLNKFLIGLACAVVVVVIAAGASDIACKKNNRSNKYITFETTGCNGYGNVYPQIDWQKIQKKYDSD